MLGLRQSLIFAVIFTLSLAIQPLADMGMDGRWRLEHQSYEAGTNNQVRHLNSGFELQISKEGVVKLQHDALPGVFDWPVFLDQEGARPVQTIKVDVRSDEISAHYRVMVDNKHGTEMEIHEHYHWDAETDTLRGTMRIQILRNLESKGEFTLTRTFVRAS